MPVVAALSLPQDYSAALFNVTTDGADSLLTVTATCYAAGTRILTPRGEIAIERLREGDLVQTISGRTQPIHWIGRRRVDFRRHPNPQRVLPVRIAAHAFGPGQPRRELLLSPDHAVFVEDVLIPVRHLINGTTVAQIEPRAITYYHIELPRHDVLLANGMPAESYLEAGARDAFANGGGLIQLHPDFAPPLDHYAMLWEAQGYAPLVVTGSALERARETLARQAQRYARSHRSRGASSRTSAPAARSSSRLP
jgi:collagen type I alpha